MPSRPLFATLLFILAFNVSFPPHVHGQYDIRENCDSAQYYYKARNYDKMEFFLEKNFELCEGSQKDTSCTESKQLYAELLYIFGWYHEADSLASVVMSEVESFGTKNRVDWAELLNFKGNTLSGLQDYDAALEYYEASKKIRAEVFGEESVEVSSSMMNIGIVYLKKRELIKAREILEDVVDLREKKLGPLHQRLLLPLNNLSIVYNDLFNLSASESALRRAEAVAEANYPKDHVDFGTIYQGLGNVYQNYGDYGQSIIFYEKANEIYLKNFGPGYRNLLGNYYNLGNSFKHLGEHERSLNYAHIAAKGFLEKYGENYFALADCYELMGDNFIETGQLDSAGIYLNRAHEIWKVEKETEVEIADFYTSLATYFFAQGQPDSVDWYRKQTLVNYRKRYGENHFLTADAYYMLAEFQQIQGQTEAAIKNYQASLKSLGWPENTHNSFDLHASPRLLIEPYHGLAEAYFKIYRETGDVQAWRQAAQYISTLDQLYDYLRASFRQSGSDFLILKKAKKTYGLAVRIQLEPPGREASAFYFSEKAKSLRLLEAFHRNRAASYTDVPDSLLIEEEILRSEIDYLRNRDGGSGIIPPNRAEEIIEKQERLDSLMQYFQVFYPDFYNARFNSSVRSLAQTQRMLTDTTALVEYMLADTNLFVFVLKKNSFHVYDTVFNENHLDQLQALLNQISAPNLRTGSRVFCRSAAGLYDLLLRPVEKHLCPRLIIVPDGELAYLPFEILLKEYPEHEPHLYHQHPYLVKEFQISYCYSANLLYEMEGKIHQQTTEHELLALAPHFLGRKGDLKLLEPLFDLISSTEASPHDKIKKRSYALDEWPVLKASGNEVFSVTDLLSGDAKYGAEASLEHFKKAAGNYRILLCATHAEANDRLGERSFLVFAVTRDGLDKEHLYVRDLYGIQLNADLVVLSACETGYGELQQGEGVVSLSRAFAYAGAKSVVNTLWKVDDEKTSMLVVTFFHLTKKDGKPKDEALALAKRAYLKAFPEQAHPYFWAGIIGVGDMSPLWRKP